MRQSNVKQVLIAPYLLFILQGASSQLGQKQHINNSPINENPQVIANHKLINHIPYRGQHIALYEGHEKSQEKEYFCNPIPLLQPQTAQYEYVTVKRQHAVTFDVVMWNDHVQQAVFDYMNKEMNITVDKRQIKPTPFEQLLLVCKTAAASCKCSKEWQPYQMETVVNFMMVCPSKTEAITLVNAFQNDAKQFRSVFRMVFNAATKQTRERDALVNVQSIRNGKLISEIALRFPNEKEIFLTEEDTSRLLYESTAIVMNQIYSEDEEVISERSENFVSNMLVQMMLKGLTKIGGDSKLWDSVFWNPDNNYRPDILAHDLSKSYNILDDENQKWLIDVMSRSRKNTAEILEPIIFQLKLIRDPETSDTSLNERVIASLLDLSAVPYLTDVNDSTKMEEDDEYSALEENLANVKWNGKKFMPKTMNFTRVNLISWTSDSNVKERKIPVTFSPVMLSMLVKINLESEVSPKSLYEDLDDKVRQLRDELLNLSKAVNKTTAQAGRILEDELADAKAMCKRSNEDLASSLSRSELKFIDETAHIWKNLSNIVDELSSSRIGGNGNFGDMRQLKEELLSFTVKIMQERIGEWNASLTEQLSSNVEETMRELNASHARQLLSKDKVHFFAFTHKFVGSNETVPFSHVTVNVGGAFHRDEGKFVAPRYGHFAFFFQATVQGSAGFSLMHNGRQIAGCIRNVIEKSQGPLAMSAIVHLAKGDQVSVFEHATSTGGTRLYGALNVSVNKSITNKIVHLTTFSGFSID